MKLAAAILTIAIIMLLTVNVFAANPKLELLNNKYDTLEQQQKLLEKQLGRAKTEKEKQLIFMDQLNEQIEVTSSQIEVLDERINLLQAYVDDMQVELEKSQLEIDEQFQTFKNRISVLAMPKATNLGIALGTNSYYDFITSQIILERAAKYDRELLDNMTSDKEKLSAVKEDIQKNCDSVENDKIALNEKRQELGRCLEQAQKQVQNIALLEEQFLANKQALTKQMKQVELDLADIYAELAQKELATTYIGGATMGTMTKPAPALTQITSTYGWRFGNSNFHTGIDFSVAGAYGKDIVAANTGKVVFVNTQYNQGYGYGKYLIIDHGGGITTLYGHCSAISVQIGQIVKKGEKIAQVGSTGWSTGPHCHFEVRVNGKHTNPLPYME